ncbi:hypothetical protein KR100_15585 [Synechococcus sp. KORDI-100]|nr:hypothetical protein KR100_15585 [Synechococcus sp. KORDI-100]
MLLLLTLESILNIKILLIIFGEILMKYREMEKMMMVMVPLMMSMVLTLFDLVA